MDQGSDPYPHILQIRQKNEFYPIFEQDADTLIYIGPPPRQNGQDDHEYNYICQYFARPYLMKSSTLRSQDSAKFEELLGSKSAKAKMRLINLGIHDQIANPDDIKYYLDLRPSTDGDDAASLLAHLSVPTGVLDWNDEARTFGVPPHLVDGTDNLGVPPRARYNHTLDVVDDSTADDQPEEPPIAPTDDAPNETHQDQADYLPLRHHMAIERLLQAIAGQDPKLDSAAKVWTFCTIAKFFDCAKHPSISTWVVSWLLAEGNANFVQCHPAATYMMASAMQLPVLLRCSYAILVGRKAMSRAKSELQTTNEQQLRTVNDTDRENLRNEDDVNRIDYAANTFLTRVRAHFGQLAGPDTQLAATVILNQVLRGSSVIEQTDSQTALRDAHASLIHYCRRCLLSPLCDQMDPGVLNGDAHDLTLTTELITSYNNMSPGLRLLTRRFWAYVGARGLVSKEPSSKEARENLERAWLESQQMLKNDGIISKDDTVPFVSEAQLEREMDWCRKAVGLKTDEFAPALPRSLLLHDIEAQLRVFCKTEMLTPGYVTDETCDLNLPTDKIGTLLCLGPAEWKYLPLWAEGCDDGTGGVFDNNDLIPDAPDIGLGGLAGGQRGMAPHPSTSDIVVDDELSNIDTEEAVSTIGRASQFATDGSATTTVISLDD